MARRTIPRGRLTFLPVSSLDPRSSLGRGTVGHKEGSGPVPHLGTRERGVGREEGHVAREMRKTRQRREPELGSGLTYVSSLQSTVPPLSLYRPPQSPSLPISPSSGPSSPNSSPSVCPFPPSDRSSPSVSVGLHEHCTLLSVGTTADRFEGRRTWGPKTQNP